jgi:aminomethyltransferase
MSKKTPLHAKHLQANAKMVDFHGWLMPLHYGSQLTEHHQVRQDAGMFDVSHMTILDLSGQRVREFLRYLLANDVAKLQETGQALYSCMLNEQGKVLDDLIIYLQTETQFRIVCNAATREKVIGWIKKQAKNFGVRIQEYTTHYAMLAIQGPSARAKTEACLPHELQSAAMGLKPFCACWNEHWFVARTGYTGEEGFEVIVPVQHAQTLWDNLLLAGVKPIGLAARDTLRLEAGMRLYGADLDEAHSPLESGLEWTVAWVPPNREFIGREALEEQRQRREHSIMVGLVLNDKRGVLRGHQTVHLENGEEGQITSGTFSPTLGIAIGLARVSPKVHEQVSVAIRNKQLTAKVVKPPFVRHGKPCINIEPTADD